MPSDLFSRNLRQILDFAWPGMGFEEQMKRTWITESVLCSASAEGARVSSRVEVECFERYLRHQLSRLPEARVVALGRKAEMRLRRQGVEFVAAASAAPPGCNFAGARESWRRAVANLE
jgi:hypothetical protein